VSPAGRRSATGGAHRPWPPADHEVFATPGRAHRPSPPAGHEVFATPGRAHQPSPPADHEVFATPTRGPPRGGGFRRSLRAILAHERTLIALGPRRIRRVRAASGGSASDASGMPFRDHAGASRRGWLVGGVIAPPNIQRSSSFRGPLVDSLLPEAGGAGESGRMAFSYRRARQAGPLAVLTRSSSPQGGHAGARPMAARSRSGS
jgi:hypothetical protein